LQINFPMYDLEPTRLKSVVRMMGQPNEYGRKRAVGQEAVQSSHHIGQRIAGNCGVSGTVRCGVHVADAGTSTP
jgi:hypothetical protein